MWFFCTFSINFNKIFIFSVNVFGYENEMVFPIYVFDQTFKDTMDLLLLINDDKSHYGYINDFNTFMFHKTKNKNKKWFFKSCLQCFSSENVLIKHKEDCQSIKGKQKKEQLSLKITLSNYQFHLKFMLILSVILKMLNFMKVLTQKIS